MASSSSSSSTSSSSDPNGWIQNPPTTFVKIHSTSREELNGRLALCVQYLQDKGRYNVVLVPNDASQSQQQQIMAFKVDNLIACSTIEKFQAQYNMIRYNADVQRQLQLYYNKVQAMIPFGIKLEYAIGGIIIAIVAAMYFIGFSKVLMMISLLVLIGILIGPDVIAGLPPRQIIQNVPYRWKLFLREQIPMGYGDKIVNNKYAFLGTTVFLIVFLLSPLFVPNNKGKANKSSSSTLNLIPSTPPNAVVVTKDHFQAIYKLGFDDATNSHEMYKSLPVSIEEIYTMLKIEPTSTVTTTPTTTSTGNTGGAYRAPSVTEFDEFDDIPPASSSSRTSTTKRQWKNPFNFQTGLACFTLYRLIAPLAYNIDGQFDFDLLKANISTLDVWKLGLIGFSTYRLVVQFVQL